VLDRLHNLFVIAERVLLVVVCHSSQGNVVVPALANTPQSPLFFDFLTLWLSRGGGRKTKIAREMRITQPIAVTGCSVWRRVFFLSVFCGVLQRFNRDDAGHFIFSLSKTRQGCHYGYV
jgi:hypothetical protein